MEKVYEVMLTKQSNEVLERYQKLFFDRYGRSPVINYGNEIAKWLLKSVGYEDTMNALATYFRMRDEWFVSQAYSLECFKKNINKVLAEDGLVDKKERENRNIRMAPRIETAAKECNVSVDEIRKRLWLDKSGVDDWMVVPPYCLNPAQFEQWKTLKAEMKGTNNG